MYVTKSNIKHYYSASKNNDTAFIEKARLVACPMDLLLFKIIDMIYG